MNEKVFRAQVTVRQMKLMVEALQDLAEQLPKNPKLYALMAESPLEDLRRMREELEQYFADLKQIAAVPTS